MKGWLTSSWLALSIAGCTFLPRDVEAPDSRPKDDSIAKRTAYAGTDAATATSQDATDSFELPKAQPVAQTSAEEPPGTASPLRRPLGYAELELGQVPPTRELNLLTAPAPPKDLPTTWTLHKTLWVGEGYLHQAQFTANHEELLALSSDSGTFHHFDVATGRLLNKISLPDFEQFEAVEFAIIQELPQRTQVVVVRESGSLLLDLASGRFDQLRLVPPGNGIQHAGRPGLYGTVHRKTTPQSGRLRLEWFDGSVALTADCEQRPEDWSLSADGSILAVAYYPSNTVQVLDLSRMSLTLEFPLPRWGGAVALSPDGSVLALGGEKLILVRTKDGSVIGQDTSYENNIDDIRFTPQADLLLVSAYDGRARSYELPENLESLEALPAPQTLRHSGAANVYALGLSRDGRFLATPSGDKTVKIWKR